MPFSSGAAPCQICTTRCTVMPTYCSLMLSPWAKFQMLRYPQLFRRSALSLVLKPTVRFQIFPPVTFSNSTCRCCLPGPTTAWLALLKAWSCSCRFNGVSLMAVFTYPSKHFYSTTACRAIQQRLQHPAHFFLFGSECRGHLGTKFFDSGSVRIQS